MKALDKFSLSLAKCKNELGEFKELLDAKVSFSERDDILPFFKKHKHLAALVGSYNPRINGFDRLATEFSLFGAYSCDLVIGDSASRNYCFVEFENAATNSVFTKKGARRRPNGHPASIAASVKSSIGLASRKTSSGPRSSKPRSRPR